jgi:hypothetical protein
VINLIFLLVEFIIEKLVPVFNDLYYGFLSDQPKSVKKKFASDDFYKELKVDPLDSLYRKARRELIVFEEDRLDNKFNDDLMAKIFGYDGKIDNPRYIKKDARKIETLENARVKILHYLDLKDSNGEGVEEFDNKKT